MKMNMKMNLKNAMLATALLAGNVVYAAGASAAGYTAKSPSGKLVLTVNSGSKLTWKVDLNGREIIKPSELSVALTDGSVWGPGAKGGKAQKVSRKISAKDYTASQIDDSYTRLDFKGNGYTVEFRVYDDAVAYRFKGARKDSVNIKNETVEYNLTGDAKTWTPWVIDECAGERYSCSFESYYTETKISQMPAGKLSILPLLADMGGGVKVAVTDVGDLDYPGMYIHSSFASGNGLKGEFAGYPDLKNSEFPAEDDIYTNFTRLMRKDYIARVGGSQPLTWKVAVVTENDTQLADCNIVRKLCDGTAKGDFSWVKPGKVAWDWWNATNITGVDFQSGMNTPTYKYYIDFAAANKLEYIIIDDGWKDGNILQYKSDCNVPEIAAYGKQKGVDVIIWLTWKDCMKYMDRAFPMYKEWGVKGLKIDFINANDQYVMSSLRRITQTAADNHLAVDYHGMQLKGLQVTYPNIVSCEGVRGLEQVKWQSGNKGTDGANIPGYDVMIPYIRQIIAPMDYTPGAMRNACHDTYRPVNRLPMSQGTRAHQVAMYVVFFSPLQMLSDTPSQYMKEQTTTDFISRIPTVFDESRTLAGEVGKYVVTARRKGDTWYVGAMGNWDEQNIEIPMSFLGSGTWKADVFADGVNANRNAEDFKLSSVETSAGETMKVSMKKGGGWAAIISKK